MSQSVSRTVNILSIYMYKFLINSSVYVILFEEVQNLVLISDN